MSVNFWVDERDGKFVVMRTTNGVDEKLGVFDDYEDAECEMDEYAQAWCDEQEARRAGDDPRYEPPDDPNAYQNEQYEQMRDFVRGETESRGTMGVFDDYEGCDTGIKTR